MQIKGEYFLIVSFYIFLFLLKLKLFLIFILFLSKYNILKNSKYFMAIKSYFHPEKP